MKRSHGMSNTEFYHKWERMKQRCLNTKHTKYNYYGGKGIKVCSKWLDFTGFYDDMFSSYKDGLSLDRINFNGNYCKENCRWVEWVIQANNKSNNVYVTYIGSEYSLPDLCRKLKLDYFIMYDRIHNQKLNLEEAINKKIRKSRIGKKYDNS